MNEISHCMFLISNKEINKNTSIYSADMLKNGGRSEREETIYTIVFMDPPI